MVFRLFKGMLKSAIKPTFMRYVLLCLFLGIFSLKSLAQNELPGSFLANSQTIKVGSLIIPMDTAHQSVPGYFNLKAYGLINALLQNEIPVKWAIKKGKTKPIVLGAPKDGFDFTVVANAVKRIFPDTAVISLKDTFYCGPFIIDSSWANTAIPIIRSFGNNVVVQQVLIASTTDIRYTLSFKPLIGLFVDTAGATASGTDTIMRYQLQEAGFYSWNYKLLTPAGVIFNQSSVYSLLAQAHYSKGDTAHANPIFRYIQFGSNYFGQCAASYYFENRDTLLTTKGIDTLSSGASFAYQNPDLPLSQFQGAFANPYGEIKNWQIKPVAGSALRSYTYDILTRSTTTIKIISAAKLKPTGVKGGNVTYLCSHDYYGSPVVTPNVNSKINGRRVFMNALFIPPSDTFGLDFRAEINLDIYASPAPSVKNESFSLFFVLSNKGYRAKNVSVTSVLPPSLTYLSHILHNSGTYNSGTGIWSIDSMAKGEFDTLEIVVITNQIGNITLSGMAATTSYEEVVANNPDTIRLFVVSRPIAENDSNDFQGPYVVNTNTRVNDSDEDGGPFGNTTILTLPVNGSAVVLDSDTIQYSPNASFTGSDSLQYLTCDQYNLCDTAWLFINVVNPLPVELSHFSGSRGGGWIKLKWTTLSESGNDHFDIEKSADGKFFRKQGLVKGFGTSSMIHQYDFKEPDSGEPILYYRLKQFDYNGAFDFSPVIALTLKGKGNLSLRLFPNPVSRERELDIHINGLPAGKDLLRITDITGRIVFEKAILAEQESTYDEFFNTSKYLERGCYIVSLITNYEVVGIKLIVK